MPAPMHTAEGFSSLIDAERAVADATRDWEGTPEVLVVCCSGSQSEAGP